MGRKKQDLRESAKRLQILQRASKMFVTLGYTQVSMDALAEAVPVSKRTLYNHFKDKKTLFTAVMQIRCKGAYDTMEQALRSDTSAQKVLTALGREFLDVVFSPDAVNMYRTAITESQQFPELGELFYESGPQRTMNTIADYFKGLHAKKILHIPDSALAANVFLSMLANRTQMKCMLGLKKNVSRTEKDTIIRYVVDVFLRGQQPR